MIAIESGSWSTLLQTEFDIAAYVPPPSEQEGCHLFEDSEPLPAVDTLEELFRLLGENCSDGNGAFPKEATPVPAPTLPPKDDETEKSNGVPRHKRPAHKRAEVKRRGKIKTNLDDLRDLLPAMQSQRKSESAILFKAADYCRQLKTEKGRHDGERESLQAEIAALSAEIDTFQKDLPAMGLKADMSRKKTMKEMYDEYIKSEIKKNWKFWIFSFMIKPLFEAYNTNVSTSTLNNFVVSVCKWTQDKLGLVNLRSVITRCVLQISKDTQILSKPEALQSEAMQTPLISSS